LKTRQAPIQEKATRDLAHCLLAPNVEHASSHYPGWNDFRTWMAQWTVVYVREDGEAMDCSQDVMKKAQSESAEYISWLRGAENGELGGAAENKAAAQTKRPSEAKARAKAKAKAEAKAKEAFSVQIDLDFCACLLLSQRLWADGWIFDFVGFLVKVSGLAGGFLSLLPL
jgi:hypothetical protein